jgi:hypothetical protein
LGEETKVVLPENRHIEQIERNIALNKVFRKGLVSSSDAILKAAFKINI